MYGSPLTVWTESVASAELGGVGSACLMMTDYLRGWLMVVSSAPGLEEEAVCGRGPQARVPPPLRTRKSPGTHVPFGVLVVGFEADSSQRADCTCALCVDVVACMRQVDIVVRATWMLDPFKFFRTEALDSVVETLRKAFLHLAPYALTSAFCLCHVVLLDGDPPGRSARIR